MIAFVQHRRPRVGPGALLLTALLACSPPASGQSIDLVRSGLAWRPIFDGIELVELAVTEPRLMRGHAVRIDLRRPGVRFLATPGNGDRPNETDGLKTSTFLARHGCQLAINAAPFSPVQDREDAGLDVVGLHVSRGEVVSPDDGQRPALLIARDNAATISRPPLRTEGVETATGGFHIVLEKGEVVRGDEALHPRTGAGVTREGGTLILLTIDGRQADWSLGATTTEVGAWLQRLGAHDGINLDGGGTTTMAIEGDDGKARVLNRPIHGSVPSRERVAGSHLGVFARRLEQPRITLSTLDPQATGYGTFQSHNQKVVANRRGLFTTHIRTRNEPYTAQTWRLSWSRDGGASFRTVHEATHATNPPVLETDARDVIYLVRVDFVDQNGYLHRFSPGDDYASPRITPIPGAAAGKYAMHIDEPRGRLHFFSHNNTFHTLDLEGNVLSSRQLIQAGPSAILQYPLLSLDAAGTLLAAWTTQAHGRYLYWDIHCVRSTDGGAAWTALSGTPVTPPIVADQTGPADRITLDDEFEAHTWLSSALARDGRVHCLYLAQMEPPRQHHVRLDLVTGRRERDTQPELRGTEVSLRGLDGFFAARASLPRSTIYCIGRDASSPRIACLASDDGGDTWYDYARSEPVSNPYAIGGCREISAEGWIVGSFTDQTAPTTDPGGGSRVVFLKIRGGLATARIARVTPEAEGTRVAFADVRGQPEAVRFSADGAVWGEWRTFAAEVTEPDVAAPRELQLRSRLGVVGEARPLDAP